MYFRTGLPKNMLSVGTAGHAMQLKRLHHIMWCYGVSPPEQGPSVAVLSGCRTLVGQACLCNPAGLSKTGMESKARSQKRNTCDGGLSLGRQLADSGSAQLLLLRVPDEHPATMSSGS